MEAAVVVGPRDPWPPVAEPVGPEVAAKAMAEVETAVVEMA